MALRRCTWVVAVLMGVLLLAPAKASADPEKLLQESQVRLRLGEFRPALRLLRRARRQARKNPGLLARVHLQTGVVQGVLRKKKKARRSFRKALRLDPTLVVERGDAKQAVRELFFEVRAGIKGTLEVTADRAGAKVTVDGKVLGQAPYKGEVVVGRHQVVVATADRLFRHQVQVVVHEGKHLVVPARLAFVGAKLSVITLPTGAAVSLGGRKLGAAPLRQVPMAAGEHQLRIELAGHRAHVQKVTVKVGDTPSLAVTLTPLLSKPAEPVAATRPSPSAPVVQPVVPRRRPFPVWTVVTGGAAVALAGVGIGMGLQSSSAHDEYQSTRSQQRYFELQDDIRTYDTVMAVSYATAGALAITSVCLHLLLERPRPTEQQARVTPFAGPTTTGVRVSF